MVRVAFLDLSAFFILSFAPPVLPFCEYLVFKPRLYFFVNLGNVFFFILRLACMAWGLAGSDENRTERKAY